MSGSTSIINNNTFINGDNVALISDNSGVIVEYNVFSDYYTAIRSS